MSVEALAVELRRFLAALPWSLLRQAVDDLDQARAILDDARQGSQATELHQAVRQFEEADQHLRIVLHAFGAAQRFVEQYLAHIGVGIGSGVSPATRVTQPAISSPDTHKLNPDELATLRRGLPPPVPTPNPERKKTHGRWLDANGKTHSVVSGRDEDASEVWRLLRAAGMRSTTEPMISNHVEMKIVARMVRTGMRHTEVAINNLPCRGRFSCDTWLPAILPEGFSLTVHGPNYRKTFTGGQKRWSH